MPVNKNATVIPYALAATNLAGQREISMDGYTSGRIINNTGAAVTLTVYEAISAQGEYALCDDVGTAGVLAAIADGESLQLPTALAACRFIKLVPAGTDTDPLHVVLK